MNQMNNSMFKTPVTTQSVVAVMVKLVIATACFLIAPLAFAASLSLSPATGVYSSNQTFTARVVVNTGSDSINAADGTIKFNPSELSVVSVSKGSVFNLWTAEPSFSNSAGTISFSGGTPTGYKGAAGTVLNITFKTKGSGPTKVNFSNGSVLAADGMGTNVLTNMSGGTYTISAATAEPQPEVIIEYVPPANTPAAPQITSTTHADPDGWSTQKTAELAWSVPGDITAVRTLLDSSANSIPSKVYDSPINSITLEDLDEGVQYFHIQFKNADGWGRVAHYRLAVDTIAPTDLKLTIPPDADLSNPDQVIVVAVVEETSGVARYKIQLDGGEPFEYLDETGSSTIKLAGLTPGYHTAIVEAFDRAGNSVVGTISFTILSFDKPVFTEYPSEINEEVIPVIKGLTRPDAEVVVTIKKIGSGEAFDTQTYTVQSKQDGTFIIIPEGTFDLGVYELVAVATDVHGAQSEPSDPIRIAVQKPGYLQFGSWAVSVLSVFVPVLALLAIAVLGFWYLVMVLRRTRRSVEREAGEAVQILAREFDHVQAEIEAHRESLMNSRKTKKLTKAEEEVLNSLSESLVTARRRVEKEIKDVEEIVD